MEVKCAQNTGHKKVRKQDGARITCDHQRRYPMDEKTNGGDQCVERSVCGQILEVGRILKTGVNCQKESGEC
jgi:hypothetical protein